ncbi:hypothetical protein PG987_008977 [Apiospora arundinis]
MKRYAIHPPRLMVGDGPRCRTSRRPDASTWAIRQRRVTRATLPQFIVKRGNEASSIGASSTGCSRSHDRGNGACSTVPRKLHKVFASCLGGSWVIEYPGSYILLINHDRSAAPRTSGRLSKLAQGMGDGLQSMIQATENGKWQVSKDRLRRDELNMV